MICNKKHRYLKEYDKLPDAQDNQYGDRHICAGCAYEEGLRDGLAGNTPQRDLSHLAKQAQFAIRMLKLRMMRVMPKVEKEVLNTGRG